MEMHHFTLAQRTHRGSETMLLARLQQRQPALARSTNITERAIAIDEGARAVNNPGTSGADLAQPAAAIATISVAAGNISASGAALAAPLTPRRLRGKVPIAAQRSLVLR